MSSELVEARFGAGLVALTGDVGGEAAEVRRGLRATGVGDFLVATGEEALRPIVPAGVPIALEVLADLEWPRLRAMAGERDEGCARGC